MIPKSLIPKMGRYFLAVALSIMGLSACSSPGEPNSNPTETPSVTPTPQPSPEKSPTPEPETTWTCKFSNGEGRVFHATDESRYGAETRARHECGIFSRNCIPLGCIEESE